MSSSAYGFYESAEARALREQVAALRGWEGACIEREALIGRREHEKQLRGHISLVVPSAREDVTNLTAPEVVARTAQVVEATHKLNAQLGTAVANAAADAARAYLLTVRLPGAGGAPVQEQSDSVEAHSDWRDALDRDLTAMVAETIVDGFPDGQFDELVATIRSQESETLARHTVGSLTEAIAHARNDRSRRDAIRVNQANELRRVAAIFATTTDTATELPIDALKAARDVLDQGGVVEAHDLLGLSAAADVADRTLAQAIAIINQQQTLSAILGYLSERGYEPQPLASAVTVENGVLVTREEWPDHALHVAVDSKARIREVRTRLAAPGADAHAADLAVENQMCADLVELRDDLKQRGVALDLTIANAEIVALPGARQPEERLIVDTARTQHDASGASA